MEITVMRPATVTITEEQEEEILLKRLKSDYHEYNGYIDDKTKEAFKEIYNYYSGAEIDRVDRW